jgi:hypothetical protein
MPILVLAGKALCTVLDCLRMHRFCMQQASILLGSVCLVLRQSVHNPACACGTVGIGNSCSAVRNFKPLLGVLCTPAAPVLLC